MGAYLNKPITQKENEQGEGEGIKYAATSMQGWRVNQEDAHNCVLNLKEDWNMFAVYDGHGGHEVAKYTALKLPEFIKNKDFWSSADPTIAIQDSFVEFDDLLRSEDVMKELKRIAMDGKSQSAAAEDSDDEGDRIQTIEESTIPLEELLSRYGYALLRKGNGKSGLNSIVDRANQELADRSGAAADEESGESETGIEKKGKRPSKSPVQDKAKRAKTDGTDELDGDANGVTESSEKADNGDKVIEAGDAEVIDEKKSDEDQPEQAVEEESPKQKHRKRLAQPNDATINSSPSKTDADSVLTKVGADAVAAADDDDSDDSDFDADEELEGEDEADEEAEDESESGEEDPEGEIYLPAAGGGETPGEDSGTTACVLFINKETIVVANAGDSRAVLCRDGVAIDLSVDHKPEDDIEKNRIINAGGTVNEDGRVNGGLNLSRALGDHCYKKNTDLSLREQMISALPDVKIEARKPTDEFLVVACDGIWNSLESQNVVDFVKERLSQGKTCQQICDELCDHCLADTTAGDGTGCDNMTVIIAQLIQ